MVRMTSGVTGGPWRTQPGRLVERPEAVGGQGVEPVQGARTVGQVELLGTTSAGSITTLSISTTRWRQWSKAAS